jgi:hypothetical protein
MIWVVSLHAIPEEVPLPKTRLRVELVHHAQSLRSS